MANTSATGGFLELHDVPVRTSLGDAEEALPPEHLSPPQERLEDTLHDVIAGVTALPGELVRPRWQPDPPVVPDPDVNWCAFGITRFEPANFPAIVHHGDGHGHDEIVDTEELEVLVSFFGPQHMVVARTLRRGIHIPQNRALLRPAGLAFVRAGTITAVPAMVALGWRARADIPLTFRLETRSDAAVLNLLKTQGGMVTQHSGSGQGLDVPTGCHACARACWREQE